MMPNGISEHDRAEIAFRLTAFHAYYDHTYRNEPDRTVRFAKSIYMSARPIPSQKRARMMCWYRDRRFNRAGMPKET